MLNGKSQSSSSAKGKAKEQASASTSWGSGGQALGGRTGQANSGPRATGAGGASVPVLPNRNGRRQTVERERSPTPDYGVDDDEDDYIEYDSD